MNRAFAFVLSPVLVICLNVNSAFAETAQEPKAQLAYQLTSGELYGYCKEYEDKNEEATRQLLCNGYITGVRDGMEIPAAFIPPDKRLFCTNNAGRQEVFEVVKDYLKSNPDRMDDPAAVSVALSLKRRYPCTLGANK